MFALSTSLEGSLLSLGKVGITSEKGNNTKRGVLSARGCVVGGWVMGFFLRGGAEGGIE